MLTQQGKVITKVRNRKKGKTKERKKRERENNHHKKDDINHHKKKDGMPSRERKIITKLRKGEKL